MPDSKKPAVSVTSIDDAPKKKKGAKSVKKSPKKSPKKVKQEPVEKPTVESPPVEGKNQVKGPNLRSTGLSELDRMLGGGLPSSATVLLSGDAGVGKTTLAMQWLAAGYSQHQETGLYITLTEPTTVLLQNLDGKSFFSRDAVASSDLNVSQVKSEIAARQGLHFVDLRQLLEEMKLFKTEYTYKDIDKIHDVLFDLIVNSGVSRVVVDSITAIAYLLGDKNLIRTFIYKMGKFLAMSSANTLLIGEAKGNRSSVFGVEEFIADGLIKLMYEGDGNFPVRTLQVKKMRGIDFDSRATTYRISSDGINLFPKQEKELVYESSSERVSTGVTGFDKLISGGLMAKSAVLISGPSGGGKTLFSIQTMLHNLKNGAKCLYISHEESRSQILRNAKGFGWDLEKFEKDGLLQILSIHPDEVHLSELIFKIKSTVNEFEPGLVVVDSLTAIANLYEQNEVHDFAAQLISLFKNKGILTLFLSATTNLIGESMASNVGISSLFDNIIMIRFVEIDSEFHHAILIIKMRGSKHDKKMYKLVFSENGIKILNSFSGYEGVFSGSAKQISKSKEEQMYEVFMEMMGPMGEEFFKEQKEKGLSISNIEKMVGDMVHDGIFDSKHEALFLEKIKKILEGEV